MNDHKSAGIEFDAVLHQMRLCNSGLRELKIQILQKRSATTNHHRDMFNDDDLVVITLLNNQSTVRIFGLVRNGERITNKSRLHKSYRRSI